MLTPAPSSVDRFTATSLTKVAPDGIVIIRVHTSKFESPSAMIFMVGIAKKTAVGG